MVSIKTELIPSIKTEVDDSMDCSKNVIVEDVSIKYEKEHTSHSENEAPNERMYLN